MPPVWWVASWKNYGLFLLLAKGFLVKGPQQKMKSVNKHRGDEWRERIPELRPDPNLFILGERRFYDWFFSSTLGVIASGSSQHVCSLGIYTVLTPFGWESDPNTIGSIFSIMLYGLRRTTCFTCGNCFRKRYTSELTVLGNRRQACQWSRTIWWAGWGT